jgi:hypothetical protein
MTLNRTKVHYLIILMSFFIIGSFLLSGCESSRVGPQVPQPNPVAPTAQPLVLNGYVKDASSKAGIVGAAVKIVKSDGTVLTTLLSDNSGKFSFDASNISESTLYVGAGKDGYAYGTRTAMLSKTANSASVSDILLTKLTVATTTITVVGGGSTSTPNDQSIANQPLTVQVPANAVSSGLQLSVSSIPAGQLPQPTNTSQVILSAGQFGPAGTQFSQPVTITFPLPYYRTPGTIYPLMVLNAETGTYSNSGFSATVNADGTTASAQVTHFTTYVLETEHGEITLSLGTPSTTLASENVYALTSGSVEKRLDIENSVTLSGSGADQEWLKDEVAGKLGFSLVSGSKTTLTFNMEGLPNEYIVNGVQVGPSGHENEKGNWEKRTYYALQTTSTTGNATGPSWTASITAVAQTWVILRSEWYWVSHDQGGSFGPYTF